MADAPIFAAVASDPLAAAQRCYEAEWVKAAGYPEEALLDPVIKACAEGSWHLCRSAPIRILTNRVAAAAKAEADLQYLDDISGAFLSALKVDPKPGTVRHLSPGTACRSEPEHITSVTVALGATLSLTISGHSDDSRTATITLKAEGGTAIGVPTVAVDQLRDAGLVL